MQVNYRRPKGRGNTLSTLNGAIEVVDFAKETCSFTAAKETYGSVSSLLTAIRELAIDMPDWVDLGFSCAGVCTTLSLAMVKKQSGEFSQSALEAIGQLTTTAVEIEREITKQGRRNAVSQLFYAKNNQKKIVGWNLELDKIHRIFEAELAVNRHRVMGSTVSCCLDRRPAPALLAVDSEAAPSR